MTPRLRRTLARLPLLACLVILIAAGCGRGGDWQELAVSEGGFSVLMRGQPAYVRQPVDTPGGKTTAHLYSSDRPDAYYAVGYADYPLADVLSGARPEALFASVRDTWVRRIQGEQRLASPLTLAGQYPGLEFVAEGRVRDAPTILHARLYLVDQRLYQVIAMGRKGEVAQGVMNRFLDSFRLIPATSGGTINVAPPPDTR